MQYRKFGRAGWRVGEIGFGCWQFGGTWGRVDESEAIDALHFALDKGVNFVDTAVAYGQGRSEEIVGKALQQWSGEKVYVATKPPPLALPDPDDLSAPMRGRYPPWHLREQVEGSLKRLKVERIDLLQLHQWIPTGVVELDWLEGLNALRLEGKIDQIGVSLRDIRPQQGVELARLGLVASQQVMFNIFEQEPLEELFPAAEASGTAIIGRVALDSGALTGTWNKDTYATWSPDDKRHQMYRGDRFARTLKRIRAVEAVTRQWFPDLAEAALRFALSPSAISVFVVGMRNRKEVELNLKVSDGSPFPEELAEALKPHAWKHEFYD